MAKSSLPLDRRRFVTVALGLPLSTLLQGVSGVSAETLSRRGGFATEVGLRADGYWKPHVNGAYRTL